MKKIHFIAIGGAAMHNLALALHHKGYQVTGSDDEIFEPSRSRLAKHGLLPDSMGWFPDKIHAQLDAVILGMHARKDNPELLQAQRLGLPVFSYPDFIYQETRSKKRAVIGGSHGKTTITSMIMHVLKACNQKFDYLVGAQIDGFETMVNLSEQSTMAVIEGDEYLASPIHPVPKFHLYHPHLALISGIAWDHINVFPTFDVYVQQFEIFIHCIEPEGTLFYFEGDKTLNELIQKCHRTDITLTPYTLAPHQIRNGNTYLQTAQGEIPLAIFGDHNLSNLEGARLICNGLGISDADFYTHIQHFKGAARRLEKVKQTPEFAIFKDFAHSPSKLKATIDAVKKQFPDRPLLACMELHTFSSLNKQFLQEYASCMDAADTALVFYSPQTIAHKKLEPISKTDILQAFGRADLLVMDTPDALSEFLHNFPVQHQTILLMSSGNWGGILPEQIWN